MVAIILFAAVSAGCTAHTDDESRSISQGGNPLPDSTLSEVFRKLAENGLHNVITSQALEDGSRTRLSEFLYETTMHEGIRDYAPPSNIPAELYDLWIRNDVRAFWLTLTHPSVKFYVDLTGLTSDDLKTAILADPPRSGDALTFQGQLAIIGHNPQWWRRAEFYAWQEVDGSLDYEILKSPFEEVMNQMVAEAKLPVNDCGDIPVTGNHLTSRTSPQYDKYTVALSIAPARYWFAKQTLGYAEDQWICGNTIWSFFTLIRKEKCTRFVNHILANLEGISNPYVAVYRVLKRGPVYWPMWTEPVLPTIYMSNEDLNAANKRQEDATKQKLAAAYQKSLADPGSDPLKEDRERMEYELFLLFMQPDWIIDRIPPNADGNGGHRRRFQFWDRTIPPPSEDLSLRERVNDFFPQVTSQGGVEPNLNAGDSPRAYRRIDGRPFKKILDEVPSAGPTHVLAEQTVRKHMAKLEEYVLRSGLETPPTRE